MQKKINLDQYIGMRCNVKYMNLIQCTPDVIMNSPTPYPLEFTIVGNRNGHLIISLQQIYWEIPLSRVYNIN